LRWRFQLPVALASVPGGCPSVPAPRLRPHRGCDPAL